MLFTEETVDKKRLNLKLNVQKNKTLSWHSECAKPFLLALHTLFFQPDMIYHILSKVAHNFFYRSRPKGIPTQLIVCCSFEFIIHVYSKHGAALESRWKSSKTNMKQKTNHLVRMIYLGGKSITCTHPSIWHLKRLCFAFVLRSF